MLSALTLSCSKSNEANNNSYYFKFKLDNVEMSASEYGASTANNNLNLTAVGSNFTSGISNAISNYGNYTGVGNYLFNNDQYQMLFNLDGLNAYSATSGQLNITKSNSTEIEGTFSCTLTNLSDTTITKQITNGVFILPLQ